MTLNVTSNSIDVKTASGQLKFSSNEPLLFISGYESGTHQVGYVVYNGYGFFLNRNEFFLNTPLLSNEIGALYITLNYVTGFVEPAQSLVGVRQPANAVIPLCVRGYPSGNTPAVDTTHMSIGPIMNSVQDDYNYLNKDRIVGYSVDLLYYYPGITLGPRHFNSGDQSITNPVVSFTWELYKYRYLDTP